MKILPRYFLIIFCSVLLAQESFSQESGKYNTDSVDILHIPEMEMKPDTSWLQKVTPAIFGSIRVQDVRFDTTEIGIYSALNSVFASSPVSNYKFTMEGGLESSFSKYLNSSFKALPAGQDREVVCFIKRLSIISRDTLVENPSLYKKYGNLDFEAEVFLRSGENFYAAFKIDTILYALIDLKKKQIKEDMQHYLLMPALHLLKMEISQTEWGSMAKRKAFTRAFVNNHYFTERFNIPVLTRPCKKGIYRSFAEFRNNTPAIQNFKVEKGKFNTILLADVNDNYIPTTKLFAYCDGEKYWILMGNYRFPMFRVGNGFEFFLTIDRKIKLLMAVDMEKGKVY